MVLGLRDIINNERGYVLVVSVLMLAVVTVIGIAATTTSTTELQIASNERQHLDNFYNAEGGLINAVEGFTTWLTTNFLTAGEDAAYYTDTVDIDSDGTDDLTVEIRCIEDTSAVVSEVSSAANDLPALSHTDPPPEGSGYSVKNFEIRRYAVTSTSASGNTQTQAGIYKVFNKP